MCLPALAAVGTAMGASAATAATVGTLTTLTAVSGLVGAAGAYQASSAQKASANAQATIARNNAQVGQWQAQDALKRGDEAVSGANRKTDQILGRQRAAMASNGLDLSTGSTANILEDSQVFGEIDAATIRNNAARAAWGYEVGQSNSLATASMYQSQADQVKPAMSAGTSLLNTGTQLAGQWYQVKGAK